MIAYWLLATTNPTVFGYAVPKEYLEFKVKFLKENPGFLLYHEHDDTKPPIGKILNAELVWKEEIKAHAIEAEIEIFESNGVVDPKTILKNGMSMSFSDLTISFGGKVEKADLEFAYDAYRTDEKKLEKDISALSEKLNIPIICTRIRRHGAGTILTFVGLKIVEHLMNKFLDDIGFYETIKKELIEISTPSESGKEINISTNKEGRGVRFKLTGRTNEELANLLDKSRASMKEKLDEPFNPTDELVIYTVRTHGDSLKIEKINKKFGSGGYFDQRA